MSRAALALGVHPWNARAELTQLDKNWHQYLADLVRIAPDPLLLASKASHLDKRICFFQNGTRF